MCVIVFMCVHSRRLLPQKNISSLIQLPRRAELEGQQGAAGGKRELLRTGSLTRARTERLINLKCALTSLISPFYLFPVTVLTLPYMPLCNWFPQTNEYSLVCAHLCQFSLQEITIHFQLLM